jgi:hypothetical protein
MAVGPIEDADNPSLAWFSRALLIALGVGALVIALNNLFVPTAAQADSVAALAGRAYLDQLASFDQNPLLIRSHAAMGALFVVLAALQFWPRFRNRHRKAHRVIGYAALACLALLPATGVACTIVYPFAGPAAVLPNVVWMAAITFCIAAAWKAVRRHGILEHEAWVTRATAMTVGITLSRVYEPILVHLFHMDPHPATAVVFWLGQGEGLIAAELWLRRRGGPLFRRSALAAGRA